MITGGHKAVTTETLRACNHMTTYPHPHAPNAGHLTMPAAVRGFFQECLQAPLKASVQLIAVTDDRFHALIKAQRDHHLHRWLTRPIGSAHHAARGRARRAWAYSSYQRAGTHQR